MCGSVRFAAENPVTDLYVGVDAFAGVSVDAGEGPTASGSQVGEGVGVEGALVQVDGETGVLVRDGRAGLHGGERSEDVPHGVHRQWQVEPDDGVLLTHVRPKASHGLGFDQSVNTWRLFGHWCRCCGSGNTKSLVHAFALNSYTCRPPRDDDCHPNMW